MAKNKKWECASCGKTQSKDTPKFRVYDKQWNIEKKKNQCYECFAKNCI